MSLPKNEDATSALIIKYVEDVSGWLKNMGVQEFIDLQFVARERESRDIIGGIVGRVSKKGVYVSMIAVRKDWRMTRGVGRSLLSQLFYSARKSEAGADVAYLATFDFMGSDYYPKVGFTRDCVLSGWAMGIEAHFFSKQLVGEMEPPNENASFEISQVEECAGARIDELMEFMCSTISEKELESIGCSDGSFAFSLEALAAGPDIEGASRLPATEGAPIADASSREIVPESSVGVRVGAAVLASFWGALLIDKVVVVEAEQRGGIGRALVEQVTWPH
jgi:GNAT superfamily N-acetyltransferase